MDALAPGIAEVCCKLLDGRYLHIREPDFIVRKRASNHSPAEHFIDPVAAQVAVAIRILPGKTVIHIQVRATDEAGHITIRLFILLSLFIWPGPR